MSVAGRYLTAEEEKADFSPLRLSSPVSRRPPAWWDLFTFSWPRAAPGWSSRIFDQLLRPSDSLVLSERSWRREEAGWGLVWPPQLEVEARPGPPLPTTTSRLSLDNGDKSELGSTSSSRGPQPHLSQEDVCEEMSVSLWWGRGGHAWRRQEEIHRSQTAAGPEWRFVPVRAGQSVPPHSGGPGTAWEWDSESAQLRPLHLHPLLLPLWRPHPPLQLLHQLDQASPGNGTTSHYNNWVRGGVRHYRNVGEKLSTLGDIFWVFAPSGP